MSGIPIFVEASALRVLVVGAGPVATRKAKRFLEAGASVRVVAIEISPEMATLAVDFVKRAYDSGDIGDAELVVAGTNDRAVNARIALDARAASRLVNVADVAEQGSFAMMSVHSTGSLTIAVNAGGAPGAALRIRDAIAERFDVRYERALQEVRDLRQRLLEQGNSVRWRECARELISEQFCESVETGAISGKLASWQ